METSLDSQCTGQPQHSFTIITFLTPNNYIYTGSTRYLYVIHPAAIILHFLQCKISIGSQLKYRIPSDALCYFSDKVIL